MPLIKNGQQVADPWLALGDEETLPEDVPVIVSLERWQQEKDVLQTRGMELGLRLRSDQSPQQVAEDLQFFSLIALEFPKFTDGRAYSYARLLRERHGFSGELRAVGNVLRDQLLFMQRCGFDAFELPENAPVEAWLRALEDFSVWYQPVTDNRAPVSSLRRRLRVAAQ
ncbi:DUF934 domain-containing protein [Fodinicurvata fenggangensis]|uniref:DUF934 domain-containing protein n=1 Tax=Fodinicurvata fenggangensis TaxID=1121830 RepID=UPI00047DAC40|nr:DUF934 domain-containing protein [Fodinicurvata fenggangensis]